MHEAFGPKPEPFLADRDVSRITAVEIFAHRLGDPRADPLTQRLTDIDVPAGYPKRHGPPPSSSSVATPLTRPREPDLPRRMMNRPCRRIGRRPRQANPIPRA